MAHEAYEIRKENELSMVQITLFNKEFLAGRIISVDHNLSKNKLDQSIINLAITDLFHLLNNTSDENEAQKDYFIQLSDKSFLLELRDKINEALEKKHGE